MNEIGSGVLQGDSPKTISTILGEVVWMMAQSRNHRRIPIDHLEWLVMPALVLGQYRIYYDEDGRPVGFASWAFLTEEAETYLVQAKSQIRSEHWRPGGVEGAIARGGVDPGAQEQDERLADAKVCVVDMVAPFARDPSEMLNHMLKDLREGPLTDRDLFARRLSPDGEAGQVVPLS